MVRPEKGHENVKTGKQKTIAVVLPAERTGDVSYSFKAPERENLLASANRLLKFEFPPVRDPKVYERLIKTNVLSAGLSKRTLETLPFPFLERIYRELWEQCLESAASPENEWLALFLLVEEMAAFDPAQMVREDIQLLGTHEAGLVHSYYYRGLLDQANLVTFLASQQYRTDFLEQRPSQDDADLRLAYLVCRRLSKPLPWAMLLASMDAAELAKYPRLQRLHAIAVLLRKQAKMQPLTPKLLPEALALLQTLLHSPELATLASQTGIPRPARELVIVEGETEKLMLPLFAKTMEMDLDALGIDIQPAGGKNSVMALYSEHARLLRIPICVILDNDAAEVARELQPLLRPGDVVFQIAEGEFEDIYDLDTVLQTINRNYQPYPEVTPESFRELADSHNAKGRVQTLRVIWQSYGLGSFDKIEFANHYAESFRLSGRKNAKHVQPPAEIRILLETIRRVRSGDEAGEA